MKQNYGADMPIINVGTAGRVLCELTDRVSILTYNYFEKVVVRTHFPAIYNEQFFPIVNIHATQPKNNLLI
jgi:hypothetical protein